MKLLLGLLTVNRLAAYKAPVR